jgi:hypothetical protein
VSVMRRSSSIRTPMVLYFSNAGFTFAMNAFVLGRVGQVIERVFADVDAGLVRETSFRA